MFDWCLYNRIIVGVCAVIEKKAFIEKSMHLMSSELSYFLLALTCLLSIHIFVQVPPRK